MIFHAQFKKKLIDFYRKEGRHDLPWKKKITPYKVLVSEVMLQQTQVERVIPFFERWVEQFPSIEKLAQAKQVEVLKAWKGLGYNSRALRLQKTAQEVVKNFHGKIPRDYQTLLRLSGVGPYTAGAIMNFAFNEWTPFIDTNIRRVFIYHFFANREVAGDQEILEKMQRVGYAESPREWGYALMDYGTFLKKQEKENPNRKSKHYITQSKFKGSDRQLRGKILDILLKQKNHRISFAKLVDIIVRDEKGGFFCSSETEKTTQTTRIKKILHQLEKEGFLKQEKKSIILR